MKKFKIYYQEKGLVKKKILSSTSQQNLVLPSNVLKIEELGTNSFFYKMKLFEKISNDDILKMFEQLALMIDSKLLMIDSVVILKNSIKNPILNKILISFEDSLQAGRPIYSSLKEHEKYLDPIIISFFEIFEKRGNMSETLNSMCIILKNKNQNKKRLIKSIQYPIIVLSTFFISLILIFSLVVPKFETIFTQYQLNLPVYTKALLMTKVFILEYGLFFSMFICTFILGFVILKRKSKEFCYFVDKIIINKIPIFGVMKKNYELSNFFTALDILLKSKYEFHLCLNNSKNLIKNKYLLDKITSIEYEIKNGKGISYAFSQSKVFDDLTVSLIRSSEVSSTMDICINRLKKIYSKNLQKNFDNVVIFVEPIFFIFISLLILWIMLAVFTPIWNMNEMLNI